MYPLQFKQLTAQADRYLDTLCSEIPTRMVGTEGNKAATDFYERTLKTFGFQIQKDEFDCLHWINGGAIVRSGDKHYIAHVSPFSTSCDLHKLVVPVSTINELKIAEITDKIVLLFGAIASEQIMPKNFPFYNPDHHKEIISLLEKKQPAAIIAATEKNTDMAGAVYPFPLFEDGDFLIPSVYMKDTDGKRLVTRSGDGVHLKIHSERLPAIGYNIIGRRGDFSDKRIVVFAHIDAKQGTPGALDNATGIVFLLLLAELLQGYTGSPGIELVALNGEDYYSNPGEQLFMQQNAGKFENIVLGINSDGIGYLEGTTSYSLYNCPDELKTTIQDTLEEFETIQEGPQWYQGDHSIFVQNKVAALAFTSTELDSLLSNIVHTDKDKIEKVSPKLICDVAFALSGVLMNM